MGRLILKLIPDRLLYGYVSKAVRAAVSAGLAKLLTAKVLVAIPCLGSCLSACHGSPELIQYVSEIALTAAIFPLTTWLKRKLTQ